MDSAFAGADWHSVMSNLKDVTEADWLWTPPRGARPIAEMVAHLAACKNMYRDHAFGAATLTWADPLADQKRMKRATPQEIDALLAFVREAHDRLRASTDALDDDSELLRIRRTNWGEMAETRWLIKATIEHDIYHAGEINRLRGLRRASDAWAFEQYG